MLASGNETVFEGLRELIEVRGAELLFLPSYSPDSNPIEEAFSKI
jgi:transposase